MSSLVSDRGTSPQRTINRSRSVGSLATEAVAILLTVVLADLTIYRGYGYAGLAVFLVGAAVLLFIGKRARNVHFSMWIIAGMLALLAARLAWYGSPLDVVVGFVLLVAFATALDGQRPFLLSVMTLASQTTVAGFRMLGEEAAAFYRVAPEVDGRRGLNVVLPLIAFVVFSGLFILANPDAVRYVSQHLEAIVNAISDWFVRATLRPTEGVFWVVAAWITAGLLRPLLRLPATILFADRDDEVGEPVEAPLYAAFRNTLLTVIVLFAAYLAYEFFTMWTRDFPKGFYYAGYAHEGAAWLTVALALATLTLSLVFSGRVLRDPRLARLRMLAWIWSLQNLLLSLAVYNRLFIYIDFNGLTRMRIVGLFGITLVVVGFLLVVWKIVRQRDFPWLIHRQLWALALAVYVFALTPVDWIAAKYNVRQVLAGNLSASMQIGVHRLDLEGIMALPPLLKSSTPEIREGVAALIARQYLGLEAVHQRHVSNGWTAFQLSDSVALREFAALRDQWQPFEDRAKRDAAIERFHDFAYQWY